MIQTFLGISWPYLVALVIAAVCCIVIGGLFIIRKRTRSAGMRESHDVTGFAYGVAGVVYAVLLGFMVMKAYEKTVAVRDAINDEARVLLDLGHHSFAFGDTVSVQTRRSLVNYATTVIDDEWPSMRAHVPDERDRAPMDSLWHLYIGMHPRTEREQVWLSGSIALLDQLSDARLRRHLAAHETIHPMMWGLLIIGGMVIIVFMYFFELKSALQHTLLISMIAGSITFVLLMILAFDHPFTGPNGIEPITLQNVVRHLSSL